MELLKELAQCYGPSGREDGVRELIIREVQDFCHETSVDPLGNLIVHKKGSGKKLLAAAHMDEIGIIITYIEEKGFLRFAAVGGLEVKDLTNRRVRFADGSVGVIGIEENVEKPVIGKLYVDIGAGTREEAEKKVHVGDAAVFVGDTVFQDGMVISKALDNRVGCYILIEALKKCQDSKNDLYFIFTVQEEVGLRGAKTAAFGLEPDAAVAVDVTDTGDTPNGRTMAVSMGKGAAVKVMDRSIVCHSEVRTDLIEAAKKQGIPYQLEIMMEGGTDAGAIHLTGSGIKTGGISIPTRYIHSPSEMAAEADIQACVELLAAFME